MAAAAADTDADTDAADAADVTPLRRPVCLSIDSSAHALAYG